MEHRNLDTISKFFDAYGKRDMEAIKQVLDENAIWIFPGNNPLSGTKRGVKAIVEFFDRMGDFMGKSKVQAETMVTGVNDDHAVECQHVWTNREDGNNLDHHWCVLWSFKNGKIVEGKHFAGDQYKADAFFNEHLY